MANDIMDRVRQGSEVHERSRKAKPVDMPIELNPGTVRHRLISDDAVVKRSDAEVILVEPIEALISDHPEHAVQRIEPGPSVVSISALQEYDPWADAMTLVYD